MSEMTNRDCQLVILGPFGRLDLNHVTRFSDVHYEGWSGRGWRGSFNVQSDNYAGNALLNAIEAGIPRHLAKSMGSSPLTKDLARRGLRELEHHDDGSPMLEMSG